MTIHLKEAPRIELLERQGYMTIAVSDELNAAMDQIIDFGRQFFRESESHKLRNSISPLRHGYRALGSEYSVTPDRPDLAEYFLASLSTDNLASAVYSSDAIRLHQRMISCIGSLAEVIDELSNLLLRYLVPDGKRSVDFRCDRDSDLQLLYYQPALHSRDLLQDTHEDGLYITLLRSTADGLELLLANGEYHRPRVKKGELLLIPGEVLSLLSGHRIQPLYHRVVREPDDVERMSLAFFTLPNIEHGQKLLPWIMTEQNRSVDIMERGIHNQERFPT